MRPPKTALGNIQKHGPYRPTSQPPRDSTIDHQIAAQQFHCDALSIPRELSTSPMVIFMVIFAIGIEHAFDVAIERPHDADACVPAWPRRRLIF